MIRKRSSPIQENLLKNVERGLVVRRILINCVALAQTRELFCSCQVLLAERITGSGRVI